MDFFFWDLLVPRSGYVSKNPSEITWPDVISDPVAECPDSGGGDSTGGGTGGGNTYNTYKL